MTESRNNLKCAIIYRRNTEPLDDIHQPCELCGIVGCKPIIVFVNDLLCFGRYFGLLKVFSIEPSKGAGKSIGAMALFIVNVPLCVDKINSDEILEQPLAFAWI